MSEPVHYRTHTNASARGWKRGVGAAVWDGWPDPPPKLRDYWVKGIRRRAVKIARGEPVQRYVMWDAPREKYIRQCVEAYCTAFGFPIPEMRRKLPAEGEGLKLVEPPERRKTA